MDVERFAVWRGWVVRGRWRAALIFGMAAAVLAGVTHLSARTEDSRGQAAVNASSTDTLVLLPAQLGMIQIGAVSEHEFPIERQAVGSIDFNEDLAAQVFPPYQGRIVKLFAKVGENVKRGQPLLTIESPDLIQAESTLIAAAGVLDLTGHTLERAKQLFDVQGIAEKDLQQSMSDQQTAEGALKAARNGVAVFGKSAAEIDQIVKSRTIDPYLVVPSPISGRVTARNAAPGDFVQPGTLPAPFAVADISHIWLNAGVTESDMPDIRVGQSIRVSVMAYPGRTFEGEISTVGAAVDPQLHRGLIRAEIEDPRHELLPGMFAAFVIVTDHPLRGAAVPVDGVVREGDGSMTVWLTDDRHRFTKRIVKVGLQDAGLDQILDGANPGAQVVTKGAVFLDVLANGGGET
jgi:membrane fusion protein, heavy metal efflux system